MSDEKEHREWAANWLEQRAKKMLVASEKSQAEGDDESAIARVNMSITLQLTAAKIRRGDEP